MGRSLREPRRGTRRELRAGNHDGYTDVQHVFMLLLFRATVQQLLSRLKLLYIVSREHAYTNRAAIR